MQTKTNIRKQSANCYLWQVFSMAKGKPALLVAAGYCATRAEAINDAGIWCAGNLSAL